MRISFKIQLYSWLVTVILGISFLWQLLEYLIYGEIQPRIVDDIVGLTYVIAILYAYKMGRKHKEIISILKITGVILQSFVNRYIIRNTINRGDNYRRNNDTFAANTILEEIHFINR